MILRRLLSASNPLGIFLMLAILTSLPFHSWSQGERAAGAGIIDPSRENALRIKLPYPPGNSYRMIQGPHGAFSHDGFNAYAYDFRMPEGSPISAVAPGRVVRVKQDSRQGGKDPAYIDQGNSIIIDHGNGLFTQYLHLQHQSARVKEGELVKGGEIIALSGNTGYSSTPHLHFQVQDATGQSLPCAFLDVPGTGIPTLYRTYESQNDGMGVSPYAGESAMPNDAFAGNGLKIIRTNLSAHALRIDKRYTLRGRCTATPAPRQVALYLMPARGGKPIVSTYAHVDEAGYFTCTLDLSSLPTRSENWSETNDQSNMFALALAPIRPDSSFWSKYSIQVTAR
ncbi:hypothetical protein CVU37_11110 [candidate division BRC1 bacterium HGW-BRC1-1]|jgi:murein DD-endopeptidase MepM/ murein hydrolase activator NlpD|nr:MAG: hypothetical protein CVU37_11110 [candidate division BRC1 bacterium HGW-BRC1-1]